MTVHHSILLKKLERYWFRGNFLSLMESYLENKTQNVYIGVILDELRVHHGVPKGSA